MVTEYLKNVRYFMIQLEQLKTAQTLIKSMFVALLEQFKND